MKLCMYWPVQRGRTAAVEVHNEYSGPNTVGHRENRRTVSSGPASFFPMFSLEILFPNSCQGSQKRTAFAELVECDLVRVELTGTR